MIHALDCITIAAERPDEALQSYATFLGYVAASQQRPWHLQLSNTRLEFAPKPAGAAEGLAGTTFAVADLAKARRLLERRAMRVHLEQAHGAAGQRLHVATDSTHGVPISLVQRVPGAPASSTPAATEDGSLASGLDHVVIRTPNPERAIALYAGRLGLSLRLDLTEPSWGARLLFFRCADLIVELAHDLKSGLSDEPDTLWGLSWRVPDVARAHARVRASGVEVSDLRAGRRQGTRLFTVRSHTAGIPTIMLGPDAVATT